MRRVVFARWALTRPSLAAAALVHPGSSSSSRLGNLARESRTRINITVNFDSILAREGIVRGAVEQNELYRKRKSRRKERNGEEQEWRPREDVTQGSAVPLWGRCVRPSNAPEAIGGFNFVKSTRQISRRSLRGKLLRFFGHFTKEGDKLRFLFYTSGFFFHVLYPLDMPTNDTVKVIIHTHPK